MAYKMPWHSSFEDLGHCLAAYDIGRLTQLTHLDPLAKALAGLTDYTEKYKSCISDGIGLFEVSIDRKIIGYSSIEKNDIGSDVETVLLGNVIKNTGFETIDDYVENYPGKYSKYLKEPDKQDDVDEDEVSDMMDEIFGDGEEEDNENKNSNTVRAKPEKITPIKNAGQFKILVENVIETNTVIASYPTIYDLAHCDAFVDIPPREMWYCEDWGG